MYVYRLHSYYQSKWVKGSYIKLNWIFWCARSENLIFNFLFLSMYLYELNSYDIHLTCDLDHIQCVVSWLYVEMIWKYLISIVYPIFIGIFFILYGKFTFFTLYLLLWMHSCICFKYLTIEIESTWYLQPLCINCHLKWARNHKDITCQSHIFFHHKIIF